jgi:hypothetical protein
MKRHAALIPLSRLQHMQLEGCARKLGIAVTAGIVDRDTLDAAAELLDAHRLEERQLFPLIEELVPDDELRTLGLASKDVTCAARRPPRTSEPRSFIAGRRAGPAQTGDHARGRAGPQLAPRGQAEPRPRIAASPLEGRSGPRPPRDPCLCRYWRGLGRSRNGRIRSIGAGKMIVVDCEPPSSSSVCRYRSCSATGCSPITTAASLRRSAA